ncbi:MAG: 3'-5' exonuclease [Candidatus Rokubacteria bacterium]|nr:3'-5' exonuclease [Candidatus Rokubacteria bacterium]
MAFMIPETLSTQPSSATAGERKVFVALRDYLPEDYLVYYDISVQGRHPDFIIVGPDLGLVVLEVKDWRLGSISAIGEEGVRLRHPDGEIVVGNPIWQVREYVLKTVDLLKKRPLLRRDGEGLACGWGYGVVFPYLRTEDVRTASLFGPTLEDALEPGRVLTADDLTAKALPARLRSLLPGWATRLDRLTPLQVDEIRGVLYPEIRIGWGVPDDQILGVMDSQQERRARSLGEGHQLLRGVAGSGKSVVLVCRARYLRERHPEWRILVLCFNKALSTSLRQAMQPDANLDVLTFHSWALGQLTQSGVDVPKPPGRGKQWDQYWTREVAELLLRAFEEGRVPQGAYQAILVDEGQDFADDWYRAVLRALDPATSSLFIALDSSQNIYRRKVSWREVGIQIVGRTRVLRDNYRNTQPILSAAYGMIQGIDATERAALGSPDEYVAPDRAIRNGPGVEIHRCASIEESREHALEWIRYRLARGVAAEEILVLGPGRLEMKTFTTWLNSLGVSAYLLGQTERAEGVRVSTIHSSKGLDADCVVLLDAHQLQDREDPEARRLLYIAMTRARQDLCVFYHRDSALMAELERACAGG